MEFRILGPLEVLREGRRLAISGGKQRAVLAALLLRRNEVVALERLIDEVWERPPKSAIVTLQGYVSQLRKAFAPEQRITTRAPGYLLEVLPGELDLERFEELAAAGRRAFAAGDVEQAAQTLAEALSLWRGPALANVPLVLSRREPDRLDELRLAALEERIEAELALGRHGELVGELEALVAEHPLRERMCGQLMLALYRAGRQAEALGAYRRARETLIEELGIEPSPPLQRLERAILVQDAALEPGRSSSTAREGNLPTPPTPLLGRQRELAEVRALARDPDVRLLTLTGTPGIGKTRLALALASEIAPDFADGARFVALAPLSDPALVASTIASALGLRAAPGQRPEEALAEHLRARSLLLVLDNFEHLLPAAPLLARLAAAAPRLKLIVTSRAVLRLGGEHEYTVPPLALPAPRAEAGALLAAPAVALFVERASAVRRDFAPTGEEARAIAAICARLDGLPLAIELAAARTKLLSPPALLERLERRLELLTDGRSDAPARQRTLRATLDWSYNLLEPAEQRLFARLAVFAGGCTLEAAEEICAEAGASVLAALSSLVDKSLLAEEGAGERRFALLETLREYALERLEESGEAEALRRRHAEHYLALALAAEPQLEGPEQGVWLTRLEREHDNLRAALAFALARSDGELALRLAGALRFFWQIHGHLVEGRRLLEAVLAISNEAPLLVRAKALTGAGALAYDQGDVKAASAFFEASLALARELGEPYRIASALMNLGAVAGYERDYERAETLFEESARLWREAGNPSGLARCVGNCALAALAQEDVERALELFAENERLAREAGDDRELAAALRSRADALLLVGETMAASQPLEQSVSLSRELGDLQGLAESFECFAGLAVAAGGADRAAALFGAADSLRESINAYRFPDLPASYERSLAATKERLDASAFAAEYERGRMLGLDEAVELALRGVKATASRLS